MHIVNEKDRIEKRARDGYAFDYSIALDEGWRLFKKSPWLFIGYSFIYFVISAVLNSVHGLGDVAFGIISPILIAGFYIAARQLQLNKEIRLETFFEGFRHFIPLFLVSLVIGILSIIGFILLIIPGIWFVVASLLAPLIVLFTKLGAWESIESSVRIVNRKWFQFLFLLIIIFFINVLGLICLIVGFLITFPLTFCIIYAAYKQAIGQDNDSDFGDDRIMDHLIDQNS